MPAALPMALWAAAQGRSQWPPEPELAETLKPATDVVAHWASLGRFLNKLEYTDKKVAGCHRATARWCDEALWIIKGAIDGNALNTMSQTVLLWNFSPALSSFATTSPAITLGLRLQRCAILDAGSFICRHTRAPSILSRWHAQTPKPACAEVSQDHSTKGSTHSSKSAIASALTTVGTSSARQDMDQTKSEAL
jgi:hypothetical protein